MAALASAEAALDRGEYRKCLVLLEELAPKYPLSQKEGAKIRLLMVTAWMGQGDNEKAMATCRLLTKCKDNEIRQISKQILSILEAPGLDRPKNWSIQIPNLNFASEKGSRILSKKKESKHWADNPLPPTGPTKGLGIGFSIVVLTVFLCLTIFLSG